MIYGILALGTAALLFLVIVLIRFGLEVWHNDFF